MNDRSRARHAVAQHRCYSEHGDWRYDPGLLSHRLRYWLPAALVESRVLWFTRRAAFYSRRARLRGTWYGIARRYEYEICMRCGRPVGPHTGSWWHASAELWHKVIGDPFGVVCPPCFTAAADAAGIRVHWQPMEDE